MGFHGGIGAAIIFGGTIQGATITGGTFQTAASGRRIVISSTPSNQIQGFTGDAAEQVKGHQDITVLGAGPTRQPYWEIIAPKFNAAEPDSYMIVGGRSADGTVPTSAAINSEQVSISTQASFGGTPGPLNLNSGQDATLSSDLGAVHITAAGAGGVDTTHAGEVSLYGTPPQYRAFSGGTLLGPLAYAIGGGAKIQTGKFTATFTAVATLTGTLVFPVNFTGIPVVQLTVEVGSNFDLLANLQPGTTSSAANWRLAQKSNSAITGTATVHWTAIGT